MPWELTGNAGTNPTTNFVGTTDSQPLAIKTAGVEHLRIDTNGNVGLGTETPTTPLHVRGAVTVTAAPGDDATKVLLTSHLGAHLIAQCVISCPGGTDLAFSTGPANETTGLGPVGVGMAAANTGSAPAPAVTGSPPPAPHPPGGAIIGPPHPPPLPPWMTERLRIDSQGNVGIGTSSARSLLEVASHTGAMGPVITLTNTVGGNQASAAIDMNTYAPSVLGQYNPSARIAAIDQGDFSNDIAFLSNKPGAANNGMVECMRVTPVGVGIGTSAPLTPLHVNVHTSAAGSSYGLTVSADPFATPAIAQGSYFIACTQGGTPGGTPFIVRGDGFVGVGTDNPSSRLHVNGDITVTGDVYLAGADCAEEFDVPGTRTPEPGTVLVIDEGGGLREADEAYDRKVAGVVSGAGDLEHALVLDRREASAGRVPVALVGKVYCRVDAEFAPITVGDLLTTSPTRGHAMKAVDPARSMGSVIGKALRGLSRGRGLIPILVALQ